MILRLMSMLAQGRCSPGWKPSDLSEGNCPISEDGASAPASAKARLQKMRLYPHDAGLPPDSFAMSSRARRGWRGLQFRASRISRSHVTKFVDV